MAIAYESVADGSVTDTSLTYAHTVGGSNRLLMLTVNYSNTTEDITSSVTYAGVAMTQIDHVIQGDSNLVALYYLIAPTVGTNNVVITLSDSRFMAAVSVNYVGCAQTSPINASNTQTLTSTTTHDASITTTVDNCWAVYAMRANAAVSAGTGATKRGTLNNGGIFDNNSPKVSAGSETVEVDTAGNTNSRGVIAAIEPLQIKRPKVIIM